MCDMPIFECLPCVPELCLDFCLLKAVCLHLLLHLLASHSSSHDRSNFISIFLFVSFPCIVQCFFVSVMFLMDLLASMFNSLAHKDLPFLEFAVEISQFAVLTAFNDAVLKSLFWIGANYYCPVELEGGNHPVSGECLPPIQNTARPRTQPTITPLHGARA